VFYVEDIMNEAINGQIMPAMSGGQVLVIAAVTFIVAALIRRLRRHV